MVWKFSLWFDLWLSQMIMKVYWLEMQLLYRLSSVHCAKDLMTLKVTWAADAPSYPPHPQTPASTATGHPYTSGSQPLMHVRITCGHLGYILEQFNQKLGWGGRLECFRWTVKWFTIYIHILFQILFHYALLQDIEYSSLCYTVGPCCSVHLLISYSQFIPPFHFPLVTISLFSTSVILFVL